jgi:hypothetical protein
MPINQNLPMPEEEGVDIFLPDVHPDDEFVFPPTFQQDYNVGIPPNIDELPPEVQEKLRGQYRFGGIKLRGDLRDETIPLSRDTMDI